MATEAVPAHVVVEENGPRDALVLRIGGELDLAGGTEIERAVMTAVASADSIVLDLRDLTFCDSTGVAIFCAAYEKAVANGKSLCFRSVSGAVRRVFEVTGVSTIFRIVD